MLISKKKKSDAMAELMGEIDAQMHTMRRGFDPGEKVPGVVVSVGQDYILVDIHSKMQGIIERTQWPEALELPESGDALETYFVEVRDGAARLALGGSGAGSTVNTSIQQAFIAKLPLEGKIDKEINGGYEVIVDGQRAFCPFSQVGLARRQDVAEDSPVGRSLAFLVVEYEPQAHTLVVSHRALLDREREGKREGLMAELREGDLREGTVVNIMPFGVFVDIGGVEGLIPNRELSWDRTVKGEDLVTLGQRVKVAILSLDWAADRFTFSLRDTVTDPWYDYAEEFGPGSYVTGKVVKLMPFGAFVMLEPGVEGLVPISRLGSGRRISHPKECVSEGDTLDLQIETMDVASKRIGLKVVDNRIRDLDPDAVLEGAQLKGIVEGIREFGIFVRLSEEKTGLLHIGECAIDKGGNPQAKLEARYPSGSQIDVVVKAVEGERISLTLPGKETASGDAQTEDLATLMRSSNRAARNSGISSIGSILDGYLGQ